MTPPSTPASRGRVVMLVDNTVEGDSRVQKSARSVAEAGWDVTLIGRSPTNKEDEFRVGPALVRRVNVPYVLHGRYRRMPRAGLRGLLGYRLPDAYNVRDRQLELLRRDVADRAAVDQEAGRRSLGTIVLARRYRAQLFVHRARAHVYRATVKRNRNDDRLGARVSTEVWHRLLRDGAWRRLDPLLVDFECAYAPVIDRLKPDVIHAHDFRMIGIAVRAARRLRKAGRQVKVIYDAHEFLPGVGQTHRWQLANRGYEKQHIHAADAIVTVSPPLAEMLVEHHKLPETPAVVLNAPPAPDPSRPHPGDVRSTIGLAADVPLVVYIGGAARQRGIATVIEALPALPDAHFAMVSQHVKYVDEIMARARALGVDDRVHRVPYVAQEDVTTYISTASAGVHPLVHAVDGRPLVNHEVALATKFFDYAHARLPMVVSDVRTMADAVRSTGMGEVFVAEDADDLARALRAVFDDPERYRKAYDAAGLLESWSWEAQAEVYREVYDKLGVVPADRTKAKAQAEDKARP